MSIDTAQRESLIRQIYGINARDFETVALQLWRFQYAGNPLYKNFCDALGQGPDTVRSYYDIPFLPISMFRDHVVKTGDWKAEKVFASSGTTDSIPSRHPIHDLDWYHAIAEKCFGEFYGGPASYTWLALLPSYLERPDSSLVDMVEFFMKKSNRKENSFFPVADQTLLSQLHTLAEGNRPTILIGVSFALLDFFEQHNSPVWEELLVIETGGMKGRRAEITRNELHERLKQHHPGLRIASEYGMTELMSQAYSRDLDFTCGPTLKVFIRDISDPLKMITSGQRGVINVIDLANIDTCAFIATDDIGISHDDGSFEVLGRLDQSDVRGCNLMYS